ncbi:ZCHC3 protein, partial [Polyodon spathula]|nr:ZCHC3 protein [Polyodon spathula]
VHLYNPFVPAGEVAIFLEQFCNVVRPPEKCMDEFGLWTGTWKIWTRFRPSKEGYEGVKHPPSSFSIGSNRGYLFYVGQPKLCRKCNGTGHEAGECKNMYCRNCEKKDHNTKDCKEKRRCNLCGSFNHLYYECPQ